MLNKKNFEIAKLCKEQWVGSKYDLSGIRVTPRETTVTDGHILLRIKGTGEPENFEPFTMPADKALDVAKALSGGSNIPGGDQVTIEHIEGTEEARIKTTNQDGHEATCSIRPIMSPFPDTDKIIPDAEDAQSAIILDLDILIPLLKQIGKFHGKKQHKNRHATFRFYKDNNHSQRIDATNHLGQELTAVIMPCRSPNG